MEKLNTEPSINVEPVSKINGTNYRNAKLSINDDLAEFRMTWQSKASLLLFAFGCSLFFIFIAFMSILSTATLSELWGVGFVIYVGLLLSFVALIIFLYRISNKVHRFDLKKRYYYCSEKINDKSIALSSIIGIQVIRKPIYSGKTKYYSFELNIVTKYGARIKIIDHSEGEQVKQEAKELADFLKVELTFINIKIN